MTRAEIVDHILTFRKTRTCGQLATETGITVDAVSGIIRRSGRSRAARQHAPEKIAAICAARGKLPRQEIAQQYGLSPGAVSAIWLSRLGPLFARAAPSEAPVAEGQAACRPRLSDQLGIRAVPGFGGISVPHVSILNGPVFGP